MRGGPYEMIVLKAGGDRLITLLYPRKRTCSESAAMSAKCH